MHLQIKTETIVGIFVLSAVALFIYMSLHIGVFRFDKNKYSSYTLYFSSVSGLNEKADVKIAGVSVGWVESLRLVNDGAQVQAIIFIAREYHVYADAQALVRQDGILGGKYLEIQAGTASLPRIPAGGTLAKSPSEGIALDELLHHFKKIAANIEEVSSALKEAFGKDEGGQRLRETMSYLNKAVHHIAVMSEQMGTLVTAHESQVVTALQDICAITKELKERIPTLSEKLESVAFPAQEIMQKINTGQGVLGKLVHDDTAYKDVTVVVNNLRGLFSKFHTFYCIVDGHVEALFKFHDNAGFNNGKGYLNFRIHPAEDYFCLIGLTAAFKGRICRYNEHRTWYTGNGKQLMPATMGLSPADTLDFAPNRDFWTRKYNTLSLNVQLGKVFRNSALRVGLFEGSAGIAVDWDIPLGINWLRWISTFELFDVRGTNRFNDCRPHLKWLNKLYVMNQLYIALGADDFISKCDKTFLFGAGVRVLF